MAGILINTSTKEYLTEFSTKTLIQEKKAHTWLTNKSVEGGKFSPW